MKKISYVLISLVVFSAIGSIRGSILAPETETFLFNHLYEVNKEWTQQRDVPAEVWKPVKFDTDVQRIQKHLLLVHQVLSNRSTDHLNIDQQINRKLMLSVLKEYAQEGTFPINSYHPHRQPYFIDNYGTACAVGQLMIESGYEAVAREVQETQNYAYVREITHPKLGAWALKNGFTESELAWIQPGYPPTGVPTFQLGNGGGANGVVLDMEATSDESLLYIAGEFTMMDGQPANSIIAWDGTQWQSLGSGVSGVIYDMAVNMENELLVVGDFVLNDDPQSINVAIWNGTEWEGLGITSMEGTLFAVETDPSNPEKIFIGGDFTSINGATFANLALFDWVNLTGWTDDLPGGNAPGRFGVNGPVYSLQWSAEGVFVGGDFNQTAPLDNSGNYSKTTNHLALFTHEWTAYNGLNGPVSSILIHDGDLYFGGDVNSTHPMSKITLGNWQYLFGSSLSSANWEYEFDGWIREIITFDNQVMIGGGFFYEPIVGIYGDGLLSLDQNEQQGMFNLNGSIKALANFQDKLYMGGDFTEVQGIGFSRIAYVDFNATSTSTPDQQTTTVQLYQSANTLQLERTTFNESAQFRLYNLMGQLIDQAELAPGQDRYELYPEQSGTYFYSLENGNGGFETGKVVFVY